MHFPIFHAHSRAFSMGMLEMSEHAIELFAFATNEHASHELSYYLFCFLVIIYLVINMNLI